VSLELHLHPDGLLVLLTHTQLLLGPDDTQTDGQRVTATQTEEVPAEEQIKTLEL